MKNLKDVLMQRDQLTEEEALNLIKEAKKAFYVALKKDDGDYSSICQDYFGLEEDYIFELI